MIKKETVNIPVRIVLWALVGIYSVLFILFYFKYVPLLVAYQLVLIPLLASVFLLTAIAAKWGLLLFVFAFPLSGNIPYLCGIRQGVPHTPTALLLFLVLFWGWSINRLRTRSKIQIGSPLLKPMLLFSLILLASGIITASRYMNFFPFTTGNLRELIVNVNGVRTGGALMSSLFSGLSYVSAFIFFLIVVNTVKDKAYLRKLLSALTLSAVLVLVFALVQRYYSMSLGNIFFFASLKRLNSTFMDPNSFGLFMAGFVPLLLGVLISSKGARRGLILALLLLCLIVFPWVGSRSAMLGLCVGILVFGIALLGSLRASRRNKIMVFAGVGVLLVVSGIFLSTVSQDTNLFKRFQRDLDMLSQKSALRMIIDPGRVRLWQAAGTMFMQYPLSGVGLGAYIIEFSNYTKARGFETHHTDSAENYLLHVGAETGIIGLAIVLWLFYEVIRLTGCAWRMNREGGTDRFIVLGLLAGIASISANLLFHSYIGAYDAKYFAWMLIAFLAVLSREEGVERRPHVHRKRNMTVLVILVLCLFTGLHLWHSTHTLSLFQSAERNGWDQNFGFYANERDERGFDFNWARKSAGISVPNLRGTLVVPLMASHPGIEQYPVKLQIFLADAYFNKKELFHEIQFERSEWIDLELSLEAIPGPRCYLVFETDRAWQPLKYLGVPDPRWLAVAMGEAWFKIPPDEGPEDVTLIASYPAENWIGKRKNTLSTKGTSSLVFIVDQPDVSLRLAVRGQKAFGVGPVIVIRLDGSVIAKTMLTSENWEHLVFRPKMSIGEHTFSVEYINDFWDKEKNQDRNVFLGSVDIISPELPPGQISPY
ncbi:O-antigen ligase family protein [Acidobacteriota bacterium]